MSATTQPKPGLPKPPKIEPYPQDIFISDKKGLDSPAVGAETRTDDAER